MAQFSPDQYNFDAIYVLSNGYYIDFKIIGPKKAAIIKTPEGAVWNEGEPSLTSPAELLVNEAILNLPPEFGDIEVTEIVQKQKPPPPKKNIQFNVFGRVLTSKGDPIKAATIKPFLFEKPQPAPPPTSETGTDNAEYTDFDASVFEVGAAISMAPVNVDDGGNFLIEYWGENEIDFKQSYVEIKAPEFFPKSVGPTLTKTGQKTVEKLTTLNQGPSNIISEDASQWNDGTYEVSVTVEDPKTKITASATGTSMKLDTAQNIARGKARNQLALALTKNTNTVSYRYISGFIFDNNGIESGVEVIVENNANLPEFTRVFSPVNFTPGSAEKEVKFTMDNFGDFRDGISYPKTGTNLDDNSESQDPSPDKENVVIDLYDLGKVVLQPQKADLEKETAEVKTQIQEGENQVIKQIGKRGLGFEVKMVALFAQSKETLKQIMLPKILGIISSFGPALVNSILSKKKNPLDDVVCPDPELVKRAIKKRNQLVNSLNKKYKMVRTVSKILSVTNAVIIGLKIGLAIGQTLTTIPFPVGLKPIYSGLVEKGFKVLEKTLEKAGIAVTALSIISGCIGVVLGVIIDLLNKLDFALQECAEKPAPVLDPVTGEMVVKPIPFAVIDAELSSYTSVASDIVDPLTGDPLPYKGFTFEIKTDTSQNFKYPKKYAIARNIQGIQVLRSESSFASSPEILIEELKFVIDRDNLRAD